MEKESVSVLAVIRKKSRNIKAKVKNGLRKNSDESKGTSDGTQIDLTELSDHALKIEHKERILSVEELLTDFVSPKLTFCLKYAAASLVFLIIPFLFDHVLFAQEVDYKMWRCVNTASGKCSEATNGGSNYSREVFCSLHPISHVPNEVYTPTYSNGVTTSAPLTEDDLDKYFIRGIHFTWSESVRSYFAVQWSLYCEEESSTHIELIWIGVLLNGIVAGFVVDKFGRRAALISSALFGSLLVLIQVFLVGYIGLVVIQILQGVVYVVYLVSSYIWLTENVPRRYRYITLVMLASIVAVGRFFFAVLVVEVSSWKDITIVILFLCWVCGCCAILLPESVQFLLSHHEDSEARRALSKISPKWRTYSKILTLTTTTVQSHREEDHFGALFTHKVVGVRVLIILYLWATSFFPLTSRTGGDLSLPVYYVIRTALSWLLQMIGVGVMHYTPAKAVFCGSLLLNVICNIMTLGYTTVVLNLAIQGLTEVSYLILLLLTHEVVPMPQRGSVFGIGYSLLGASAIINSRFFNPEGGSSGVAMRITISVLMVIGAALSYLLPVIRNKHFTLPFTIGEAKERIERQTITISEKDVVTSSPSTDPQRDEGELHASREDIESCQETEVPAPEISPGNLRYIVCDDNSSVDRYVFLDKGNRQLDIRIEKNKKKSGGQRSGSGSGKESVKRSCSTTPDESLVIVNVYRDSKLEKSYHQRAPSLVIEYDSSDTSEINNILVVESAEIGKIFNEAYVEEQHQNAKDIIVSVKRRNPQSSGNYAGLALEGNVDDTKQAEGGEFEETSEDKATTDNTFELVQSASQDTLADMTPLSVVSGTQLTTVTTYGSDEQTIQFSDSDSDTLVNSGTLRKFNTHMHLEKIDVASEGSSSSGERWGVKMSNIETRYEGDNVEYIRYQTPDPPTPETVPEQSRDIKLSRVMPVTELEFNLYSEDSDSPFYSFFPLNVSFQNASLNNLELLFESGSSEGNSEAQSQPHSE